MSNPRDQSDLPGDFSDLDEYVERLHQGHQPGRGGSAEPQLSSLFDCLDVLESLAPERDGVEGADAAVDDHGGAASDSAPQPADDQRTASLGDFGDYELIAEIGRGGMGVVYKARQKSLDRIVAIKMILASHLASPDQIRRFHSESKTVATVHHPHIVRIHEAGELHGQHYFAMEFVPGVSLAELLRERVPEIETSVRYVTAVARAVHHLHTQGVVHRDLKPSNILLDEAGEPLVTDFGLAKTLTGQSDLTHSGLIVGTPSYMAPEQAAGNVSLVGPRSDVYSLGVILYELLTGEPPFREDNPLDTLVQVLEREPILPRQRNKNVPRDLEMICLKCLEKNPQDRYQSAVQLADDLERYMKGDSVEARAPHPLARTWRWARREPALAARMFTIGAFYLVELANYHVFDIVDWTFHFRVSAILAVWAVASIGFQRLLRDERWMLTTRLAWGAVDTAALLGVLLLSDGIASPILFVYPLLIVASGLWFRVRLVWAVMAMSVASYVVLMIDYHQWRPEYLQGMLELRYYRHVDFILMLVGLAIVVAFQVRRIRTLSNYYEKRRPSR